MMDCVGLSYSFQRILILCVFHVPATAYLAAALSHETDLPAALPQIRFALMCPLGLTNFMRHVATWAMVVAAMDGGRPTSGCTAPPRRAVQDEHLASVRDMLPVRSFCGLCLYALAYRPDFVAGRGVCIGQLLI